MWFKHIFWIGKNTVFRRNYKNIIGSNWFKIEKLAKFLISKSRGAKADHYEKSQMIKRLLALQQNREVNQELFFIQAIECAKQSPFV